MYMVPTYIKSIIDTICFSPYKIINILLLYLLLCISLSIVLGCIRIVVLLLLGLLQEILNKIEMVVLGKYHEKSINYNSVVLWYIKFESDVFYFIDWLKNDVAEIYKIISFSSSNTLVQKVRNLSIDNLLQIIKRIFVYFFKFSVKHITIIVAILFYFYKIQFINIGEFIKHQISQNKIVVGDILDGVELLIIICTVLYIVLDVRHKANGYSGLREERFKELVVMEEKLLFIMQEMSYSLEKNIESICLRKSIILQKGASDLIGKECYFSKKGIKYFNNKSYFISVNKDNDMFQEFDDMKENFQKLTDLQEEFNKSSLSYSNIYLVDHQTMLTRVWRFWRLGYDNKRYKEMEFFCKTSMEEWYNNWFLKATNLGDGTRVFLTEEKALKIIWDASDILDFELQRAFELELYIRKYKRKIIKRIKKIHRFSRFSIS